MRVYAVKFYTYKKQMKDTENLLASKPMLTAITQGAAVNWVEFFAGSSEISEEAKAQGMNTFTIDWKQYGKIDLVKDVEQVEVNDIPFVPDAGWFSPDCTTYTISAISTHRNGQEPKSEYAKKCDKVNQHFIGLIKKWLARNPKFIFFIENPRGMLRHMDWMKEFTGIQFGIANTEMIERSLPTFGRIAQTGSQDRCAETINTMNKEILLIGIATMQVRGVERELERKAEMEVMSDQRYRWNCVMRF